MASRITKLTAAAAVFIVAAIIGIYQLGGSIDSASIAWADVVAPILTARTATYTMIVGEEGSAPEIQDMISGSRIRRSLAGVNAVTIIDLENARILTLDPDDKSATYIDLKGLPKGMNVLENLQNLITLVQKNPDFVVEELGEQEIDGQTVVGFRARHPKVEVTLWADPATRLPVRIEQTEGQVHIICKDYLFDVDLDESLFSMDVPEGYTRRQQELDLLGSTEADFIEGLRVLAEVVGDGIFPDDVSVEHFVKQTPTMQKAFAELDATDDEKLTLGMKLERGVLFIRFFKGEGEWRYAGKGVALGDAETAIFWYRPKDSQVYRVIYGDLSVKEASATELGEPEPAETDAAADLPVQSWSLPTFIGRQKDEWHITAAREIEAHSFLTLRRTPEGAEFMPIALPYPSGVLESVTLGDTSVPFNQTGEGRYELDLPLDTLAAGHATFEVVWRVPLAALQQTDYGYQTVLKSLIPVASYKLTVILSPDCGLVNTSDPDTDSFVPFSIGRARGKSDFSTCGIAVTEAN